MLKNEMESYVIGERGLENLTYPFMSVEGVKNCQNHPYVINESPLTIYKFVACCCYFCVDFFKLVLFNFLYSLRGFLVTNAVINFLNCDNIYITTSFLKLLWDACFIILFLVVIQYKH